ncbi:helix-turn-helix domain-containing protein [Mycobacteroides abscessus]|uniref:helix-turn-helix domain-containing protein n=1 Tax=Mycobacteroides abscessus TaxID=36809 RepID=UPI00092C78D2|nr:helix-turn-helix transcriptional regulator [Mycobacteroides abscessus]RIR11247.1 XRE family transcriptional regulator [Mycobacteroides abscessus]SIH48165.1 Helix-turn-helix [Mycobacteroides abscessus subsp. abscessus]SKQ67628.1 Helix-turn-helix [Mycobacteroides abscessus subsp. abscessus]
MQFASTDERVAANVRAELARAGESQSSLAPKVDMSQQALSRRLSAQVPFTVTELSRIASVLGVPIGALTPTDQAVAS